MSRSTPVEIYLDSVSEPDVCVVYLAGEIDVSTCELVETACFTGNDLDVVIDLADVRFMDCAAYAGLKSICHELTSMGGSLAMRNTCGQPARLLAMINSAGLVCDGSSVKVTHATSARSSPTAA
ncbi:hypothetical protein BH09ACT9_BH09ACT9_28540 [soil metagenome]